MIGPVTKRPAMCARGAGPVRPATTNSADDVNGAAVSLVHVATMPTTDGVFGTEFSKGAFFCGRAYSDD
jgi:hypothetical protein